MNIFNIPSAIKAAKENANIQIKFVLHLDKYLWLFCVVIAISVYIIFWMVLYDIRLAKNYYRAVGIAAPGVAETLFKFPIGSD